jgi:hypothetical protein
MDMRFGIWNVRSMYRAGSLMEVVEEISKYKLDFNTVLRGRWCNIIVLNVHPPTEDKIDDIKDRFYDELGQVFDKFPKYHMKMLGDFNAKVGREDII